MGIAENSCTKSGEEASAPALSADKTEVTFNASAGQQEIQLTANREWSVVIPEKDRDWVWLSKTPEPDKTKGTLTIHVASNVVDGVTTALRSTVISLFAGDRETPIIVSQEGAEKIYMPIAALRAMANADLTTAAANIAAARPIRGTVISDGNKTTGGNINPGCCVIEDGTEAHGGITLQFPQNVSNTYLSGDVIEVDCNGATLEYQGRLMQLRLLTDGKIIKLTSGVALPEPIPVTPDMLGDYESQLVSVSNCQVVAADLTRKFNAGVAGEQDATRAEVPDGSGFVICALPEATFANRTVPQNAGQLVGIAERNGGNAAILPRTPTDWAAMILPRFTSQAPVLYEAAASGRLTAGVAITDQHILLSYHNPGDAASVYMTVSVVGDAGISAEATNPCSLAAGAGTIAIPLSGTPTMPVQSTVTFQITITGDALTGGTATAEATLSDKPYAPGDVIANAALSALSGISSTSNRHALESGVVLERLNPGSGYVTYATGNNGYFSSSSWTVPDAAWLITFPVTKPLSGEIKFSTFVYGSNTGPKDWKAEYSVDGNEWYAISSYSCSSDRATGYLLELTAELFTEIVPDPTAKLYLKLTPSGSGNISESGNFTATGTNRLQNFLKLEKPGKQDAAYASGDVVANAALSALSGISSTSNLHTLAGGIVLERLNPGNTYVTYATGNNGYFSSSSWTVSDAAWLITFPVAKPLAGTIKFSTYVYGSNTGPRDWTAEYSVDGTVWNAMSPPLYACSSAQAAGSLLTLTADLAAEIIPNPTANLYIKLTPSGSRNISDNGNFAATGTNRLQNFLRMEKQ